VVATLVDGTLAEGEHVASWNGKDSNGSSVASGVYFYRLEAENKIQTRRMVLLK
jgi:flagellar hook assembly protein FlgD